MFRTVNVRILILGLLTAQVVHAQQNGNWRDPSSHKVQFVTVEKTVQLEVLDWGGTGRPVVLLAGSGNTAHIFDDFAEKLAGACCHVYGIMTHWTVSETGPRQWPF